jgi:bifunctional non-homologous end joining protein LigD
MGSDQPERYTTSAVKAERPGKIFIDYLRNARGQTAVAPYSTRARPGAPVACPLAWEELSGTPGSDAFTVATIRQRLAGLSQDPWAELPTLRQTLPALGA